MQLRHPLRLLVIGLALGAAFDLLFNGKLPGVSLVIFAGLVLIGLAAVIRWEHARGLAANLWLPAAVLFFAAMGAVRASPFLVFLNISACLVLLALLAIYLTRRPVAEIGLLAHLAAPVQAPLMALVRGGAAVKQAARHDLAERIRPGRRQLLPVARGLLLAAPVVIALAALLASADLVFADLIERVFSQAFLDLLGRWAGHGVVTLVIGFLLAGGLAYAVWREGETGAQGPGGGIALPDVSRLLGSTEALVLINAVNALFLLFVTIQIPYLFGGYLDITRARFTYAEYARRGFGELVAVAVLTLGLIVALNAVTRRESDRQRTAFNASGTALLAFTGVMLVSAFKRLWLYELAYGFTRMRIYPQVFMVWLGLLLAWFVITLWLRPNRFAIGVLVIALGFVGTLDVINPDALIVRLNYQHHQTLLAQQSVESYARREIDSSYLTQLSEDAVPDLIWLVDRVSGEAQQVLDAHLRQRLAALEEDTGWRRWQSWHVARSRAYRELAARYPAAAQP